MKSRASFIPFKGARDRIKRAETHSAALAQAWNALRDAEFYEPFCHMDSDGTGTIRCIPITGVFPEDFPMMLGEILYQLRAALDNLIYDAAILDTGSNPPKNPRSLEFPIYKRKTAFDKNASKIAPLSDKRRAFIEAVQPYNTPKLTPDLMVQNFNRTLGILGDWARKDRHRTPNILRLWAVKASPKLKYPPTVSLRSMKVHALGFLDNKDKIATFRLAGFTPGMKVQANPDLFFDIAVDNGPPPCHERDSLGNRLASMIMTVKVIANAIEHNLGPHG